jgi:uncharacterized protein YdeI (YjbR/CyaY-like superfamily)
MNVGTTLYVKDRKVWRTWLAEHHATASDIWLIYYKKGSGKERIPYNDAVEEALCYGWIDSIVKSRDEQSFVQRFSPRKPKSVLSELNKERVRRLIASKRMRKPGLVALARHLPSLGLPASPVRFVFPKDILDAVRKDPAAWKHYRKFPLTYRRIRIGWIDNSRSRPEFFRKRLRYFIAMTAKNKRFGTIQ